MTPSAPVPLWGPPPRPAPTAWDALLRRVRDCCSAHQPTDCWALTRLWTTAYFGLAIPDSIPERLSCRRARVILPQLDTWTTAVGLVQGDIAQPSPGAILVWWPADTVHTGIVVAPPQGHCGTVAALPTDHPRPVLYDYAGLATSEQRARVYAAPLRQP